MQREAGAGAGYAAANFTFSTPASKTLPETHMRCMITANLRATATRARLAPASACNGYAPASAKPVAEHADTRHHRLRLQTAGLTGCHWLALPSGVVYCAAARIGMCDRRKRRTRSIVCCFSSSGSFHGNTVISALGAKEATSIDVCSGCPGTSSGSTSIGVGQFLMNSRETL